MKKVCILSMQRVNNFGSLLQGYSLMKILKGLNCDVSFIDIKKNDEENALLLNKKLSAEDIEARKSKLSKIDKYFLNRLKIKKMDNRQNMVFEEFRRKELNLSDKANEENYDLCVIGSDEVFNCTIDSKWGVTSQLFGNVQNANEVITYAASCGSTKIEDLNNPVKELISTAFKRLKSVSVRDRNTYNFVSNLSNLHIEENLDPVLVGNFDKEISENSKINLPKRFCIVYSYYNRFKDKNEIKEIRKFCKLNNLELVTVGAPQFWIKKHLVLNPFEALYAFSKAEFVITDTFHGTIFASKFSNKFATVIRDSNRNKLSDLIEKLDKKQHLCKSISDINKIYSVENDISKTNAITNKEREKTIDYLKANI